MVSGYLLLAMKQGRHHSFFYFVVLLLLSLILLLALLLPPIPGITQDTPALEVWRIGNEDTSAREFDTCPGREEIHYTILDNAPAVVSDFPCGLADSSSDLADCLPSKINLYFSLENDYYNLTLQIVFNGWGEVFIYGDSLPLQEIMINAPSGSQIEEIAWPYLSSGEHNLVLEATGNDSYAYFDYIKLEGFRDMDQDGIIDQEEGDLDSDGDGSPDWQDADCATIPIPLTFPYEGTLLLTIKSRETCQDSHCLFIEAVTFFDIYSLHDPNQDLLKAPLGEVFTYGIISVSMKDLPEGGLVMFTLIPPRPFHGIEKVWAEDYEHQWRPISYDLIDNQMDFILTDGDFSDRDGEANGEITASFGLTIPTRLQPYAQESCFISTLNRKGSLFRSCFRNQRIP